MQKNRARKKLKKHTKLRLQKNIVILFILALILSPFGSLSGQVYASEDDSIEASEELVEERTEAVDKAALEDKLTDIDEADLAEADYTDSSWETLQETVTDAELVLADDDETQDVVNESFETITEDYDALKEVEEPTEENKPAAEATAEDDSEKDDEADASEENEATNDEQESEGNETDREDGASENNKMKSSKLKMQPLATSDGYVYEDNPDGITVTITGYTGSETDLTIPGELDGKDVTIIGEDAFYDKDLTSVNIPDSVIEIERDAFDTNYLTSVVIPDSVTEIGRYAFDDNDLTEATIHNADVVF